MAEASSRGYSCGHQRSEKIKCHANHHGSLRANHSKSARLRVLPYARMGHATYKAAFRGSGIILIFMPKRGDWYPIAPIVLDIIAEKFSVEN